MTKTVQLDQSDLPEHKPISFAMVRLSDSWIVERVDLDLKSGPFSYIPESFANNEEIEKICADLQLASEEDKGKFRQFLLGVNVNLESRPAEVENPETEFTDAEGWLGWFFNEDKEFISKTLGDHVLRLEPFLTNILSREIFVYREGFFQPIGEQTVEQHCKRLLGNEFKIHRATEVIGYIRASTYTEPKEPTLNLINLENGILDLDTLLLVPHNPKYMFFQKIPVKYDPEAKCPLIEKFLTDISSSQEDKTILLEWIGYNLLRSYPIQKSLMLIGEGANGKSTFLNLIKNFLGQENVVTKSLQDLEYHRFAKASLFGKLANISPDLPDIALKRTGTFKALTGGDPIDGEKKFKDSFPFWNYAKLSFSCNKMPQVDDNTDAFFRRWLIAVFPHKFEGDNCDQNILEKICTPQELSGLLNIALEALKKILKQKGFSYSQTTEQVRNDYIAKSDPEGGFAEENLTIESKGEITKKELYKLFCAYCREKNLPIINYNTFFKNLPKYKQFNSERQSEKGQREYVIIGLKLTEEGEKLKKRSETSEASEESKEIAPLSNYPTVEQDNIGKTPDSSDSSDKKCFLCNQPLPKNDKFITYLNEQKVHLQCANEDCRRKQTD